MKIEMNITIRKASERGQAGHGWLNSHHSFSFADCREQARMGFVMRAPR